MSRVDVTKLFRATVSITSGYFCSFYSVFYFSFSFIPDTRAVRGPGKFERRRGPPKTAENFQAVRLCYFKYSDIATELDSNGDEGGRMIFEYDYRGSLKSSADLEWPAVST